MEGNLVFSLTYGYKDIQPYAIEKAEEVAVLFRWPDVVGPCMNDCSFFCPRPETTVSPASFEMLIALSNSASPASVSLSGFFTFAFLMRVITLWYF